MNLSERYRSRLEACCCWPLISPDRVRKGTALNKARVYAKTIAAFAERLAASSRSQ
jgi:hypothetical protein